MKNHYKTFGIMGSFFGLILCLYIFSHNYNCKLFLQDKFEGTFVAGEGIYQTSFSIDQRTSKFYYINQNQKLFVEGRVETYDDSVYYIECYNSEDSIIIPNQTIEYDNLTFSVNINDNVVCFNKNSNTVVLVTKFE